MNRLKQWMTTSDTAFFILCGVLLFLIFACVALSAWQEVEQ